MLKRLAICAVGLAVGFAWSLPAPADVVFAPGNVFMVASKVSGDAADPSALIVEFTPSGDLVRLFNANGADRDMEFRDKFHLYVSAGTLREFTPDGVERRSINVGAHGIGIGPDGHVYTAYRGGNTISNIDTWQTNLTQVGSFGTGVTGDNTFDVAVPENGKLYVAHYWANTINRYDAAGTLEASVPVSDNPHSVVASPDGQQVSALGGGQVHQFDPDLNPTGDWGHSGRLFMNYGEDGRLYVGTHSQLLYSRAADGSDHQVIASGTADFTFAGSLYRAMSAQTAPGKGIHMFVSAARWAGDPDNPGTTPWWQTDGGAIFEFDEYGNRVRVLHDGAGSYARGMGVLSDNYIAVNASGLKIMNTVTGEFVASGGGCDGLNVGTNGLIYTAVRGSKVIQEYRFDAGTKALTLLRTLSTQAPASGGSDTIDVAANDEYFYVAYYQSVIQQYRLSDGSLVNQWIDPLAGNAAHGITIDPRTGNVVARGTSGDVRWFDPDTLALLGQGPWEGYTTFLGFGPDDLLYTAGAFTSGPSMSLGEIRVGTPGQNRLVYIGPDEFVYNGRRYWASDVAFVMTVPEPAALVILVSGGLGILLALCLRRRG